MMEGCVFREFLLRDAPHLTDEQLDACLEDLVSMGTEGYWNEFGAYEEWLRRLGGKQNIRSYADTLLAGKRRRRYLESKKAPSWEED